MLNKGKQKRNMRQENLMEPEEKQGGILRLRGYEKDLRTNQNVSGRN